MIALLATAYPPVEVVAPWYTVRQTGGGLGNYVDEKVVLAAAFNTTEASERGLEPQFWIAEQQRSETHPSRDGAREMTKHRWLDGRKCPALAAVLRKLGDIPPAHFVGGGKTPSVPPPSDTPGVEVEGRARRPHAGSVSISDIAGPISNWWWSSSTTLEPCWQKDAPIVAGTTVKTLLSGLPTWVQKQP